MSEELTGDALKERARELDIEGRSGMSADELRAAIAEAEDAAPDEPASDDNTTPLIEGAPDPVDSPQAPFTPPVPTTGVADMTSSPAPTNDPSGPNVELPASVHKPPQSHTRGA